MSRGSLSSTTAGVPGRQADVERNVMEIELARWRRRQLRFEQRQSLPCFLWCPQPFADLQPADIGGFVQPEVRYEEFLIAKRQRLRQVAVRFGQHPFQTDTGIDHQHLR